eukprot:1265429-Rhodomonas_salina.1
MCDARWKLTRGGDGAAGSEGRLELDRGRARAHACTPLQLRRLPRRPHARCRLLRPYAARGRADLPVSSRAICERKGGGWNRSGVTALWAWVGCRYGGMGEDIRAVTHCDVSDDDIEHAVASARAMLAAA